MSETTTSLVRVAAVADLPPGAALAVKVNGHAVALFNADGVIRAIDNRCPHMGYPLVEAPVRAGVLRCPWHHWRFELSTGGCLTTGGDDVGVFTVEVRDDQIYLSPEPTGSDPESRRRRARRFLHQGMTEVNTFLMAKSLCSLRGLEDDSIIIRQAVEHGLRFRSEGFGPGLVILTCLLNFAHRLNEEDQLLALVHGITHVARDSANRSPRRELPPLPEHGELGSDELADLFRFLCEDREATGAERVLLTVLARRGPEAAAELLLAAATDHYFLSTGHVIDFINKAYELLDHLGGELTEAVLGSLVRPIATGFRHEEAADWADMVEPLGAAFADLPNRPGCDPAWTDPGMVGILLDGEPDEIIAALREAIAAGAGLRALSALLCQAAMLRVARFHLQNENDWDDVLHLVSYC
ncbi:MAG: Rieske 2Fe-2S domain-containing protein, partial [Armatimonadetes bacterium]|nr:Rieske 2Fe-2S domain-containing protein [Armatimonadota bacterium]